MLQLFKPLSYLVGLFACNGDDNGIDYGQRCYKRVNERDHVASCKQELICSRRNGRLSAVGYGNDVGTGARRIFDGVYDTLRLTGKAYRYQNIVGPDVHYLLEHFAS